MLASLREFLRRKYLRYFENTEIIDLDLDQTVIDDCLVNDILVRLPNGDYELTKKGSEILLGMMKDPHSH